MERVAAVTTVAAVAEVLREEILARPDDRLYLGQEDEILERLGVSRPTLRQAVRVLEAEGILTVRRGHHGGLYARRPDASGVTHMASVFLRTRGASVADLSRAYAVISTECARLAALNPDLAERARLLEFVESIGGDDWREHLRERTRWGALLAEIASSPTLRLFEEVLASLAFYPNGRPVLLEPEEIAQARDRWRRAATAVRDGDAVGASEICREYSERMVRRIEDEPEVLLGWSPHLPFARR
jgi:DNA-binding FadR family transcriptional regulator